MFEIVGDLPGVVCHMDDILIFGKNMKEHDFRLETVLNTLSVAGVT